MTIEEKVLKKHLLNIKEKSPSADQAREIVQETIKECLEKALKIVEFAGEKFYKKDYVIKRLKEELK